MLIDVVEPFKPPTAADPDPMFLGGRTTTLIPALGLSGIDAPLRPWLAAG